MRFRPSWGPVQLGFDCCGYTQRPFLQPQPAWTDMCQAFERKKPPPAR